MKYFFQIDEETIINIEQLKAILKDQIDYSSHTIYCITFDMGSELEYHIEFKNKEERDNAYVKIIKNIENM